MKIMYVDLVHVFFYTKKYDVTTSTIVLLFYVVPRFSRIYDDIRGEIPFLSRVMLEWGKLVEHHWAVVLAVGVGLLTAVIFLVGRPAGRDWLARTVLRIPALDPNAGGGIVLQ